jgi:hypothetical protein
MHNCYQACWRFPRRSLALLLRLVAVGARGMLISGAGNAKYNTFAVFDLAQRQSIKAKVLGPHAVNLGGIVNTGFGGCGLLQDQ